MNVLHKTKRPPEAETVQEVERLSRRSRRVHDFIHSLFFSGPSFLGMLIFFIIPFGVVVYYSFIAGALDHSFAGLKNYISVIQNGAFKIAVKNTAVFSALSVPLAVILALALALMLEARIPFKSQFRTFFLSPMMVPIASIILVWQVLFHDNGVVNEVLKVFGKDKIYWFSSNASLLVIVILFLWKNLGYNMILFMSALAAIPGDITEACMLDGAGPMRVFFKIKLPYISSTVLFVTILSLISSFKIFREVYLMTGRYPYERLYMLQHFMNNTFESLDYQKLSAAAIIMCAVMIVLIGALFIIDDKLGRDIES